MKLRLPVAGSVLALSAVAMAARAANPGAPPRPNIILAMADDMGWGDPGFNGNKVIRTPNLDAMAAAGLRFDRYYSAAPVCSPTRGGCLTGRHPYRYGIWTANAGHLRKEEISLADAVRTQGYATGHFGKWHLGTLSKGNDGRRGGGGSDNRDFSPPWEHGFDVCFSTEQAVPTWNPMVNQPFPTKYWTGPGQAATDDLEGDDSRVIMDRALPFIRKAAADKQPFLAVIWFHAPHEPVVAGPEFRQMYSDRSEGEQNYYGAITALDVQMGRLRKELRALGIADNTLLWFASDNGPEGNSGDVGTTRGTAGPFRGRKRSLWEGGIHVPGLLEWPSRIKAGTVTDLPCSTLDYFPTTLDLLGFKMRGQPEPIDGVSLVPLFAGKMKERPVPIPFETLGGTGTNASRGSPRMALVGNRFKFLTDMGGPNDRDLLFDLIADPGETTNLAGQHPEVAAEMKQKLVEFRASYRRSLAGKDYAEPFTPTKYDLPPSDPGFVRESVRGGEGGPARKAGASAAPGGKSGGTAGGRSSASELPGKIERQDEDSGMIDLSAETASRHGRLLYRSAQENIGEWTNPQDWLSWQCLVYQPGRFDVEVTTGQVEAGNVYEIAAGDQTIRCTAVATGGLDRPNTRLIGSLQLDRTGPYTLSLRPVSKKGDVVMTLWRVDLIPERNN